MGAKLALLDKQPADDLSRDDLLVARPADR